MDIKDKKALVLMCAIAIATSGEKNPKTIAARAIALAEELGELDGKDSDSDDTEADDNSDSTDDDDDTDNEDETDSTDESEEEDDEGNDESEEDDEDGEDDDEDDKPKKKASKKSPPSTAGNKAGKAKKSEAKTPGKKKFKAKPQAYARDNDTHKEIFSGVLKAVAPNWKKDASSKKRAKDVSVKLEGAEFLDAEGNVLATFKQSVKKAMLAKK